MSTVAGKCEIIRHARIVIDKCDDGGNFIPFRRKGAYFWSCFWNGQLLCRNNGSHVTKKGVLGQIRDFRKILKVPCDIEWRPA